MHPSAAACNIAKAMRNAEVKCSSLHRFIRLRIDQVGRLKRRKNLLLFNWRAII